MPRRERKYVKINISMPKEILVELDAYIDYMIKKAENREEIRNLTRSGVIAQALQHFCTVQK